MDGLTTSHNCLLHGRDGKRQIVRDNFSRKAQDTPTKAPKFLIPGRVSARAFRVVATIDFNDEVNRRSCKVRDEAPDDELPTELHSKLIA